MREIGAIADRDAAKLFADYLLTLGIASRVDHEPSGWVVWVRDEDQVGRGRQELEQFLRDPNDPRYHAAPQAAAALRREEDQREVDYRRRHIDVRSQWGRMAMRRRPVTFALLAGCVIVAFVSEFESVGESVRKFLYISDFCWRHPDGTFSPAWDRIRDGQFWRLVTPIFLHFGIPHIVFNLWAWYILGSIFEIRRGSWRLALFVLITGVFSNVAQYQYTGYCFFGGMSGVIYGLFGYIWMKSRFDPAAGMYIDPTNTIIMIAWLFLCMTGLVGPIANTAHVVGLLVGMAVGIAPVLWRKLR